MNFVHLKDCRIKMRVISSGVQYSVKVNQLLFPGLRTWRVTVIDNGRHLRIIVTERKAIDADVVILDTVKRTSLAGALMQAESAIDYRIGQLEGVTGDQAHTDQ